MDNNAINESLICMGCLSVDRKLELLNEECQQIYCEFINQLNHSLAISFCFECLAHLRRTIRFKKQVKKAYSFLISYSIQQTPKSLSILNTRDFLHIDSYIDNQSRDPCNVIHSINNEVLDQHGIHDHTNNGMIKNEEYKLHMFDQKANCHNQINDQGINDDQGINVDQEIKNVDQNLSKTQQYRAEPLAFIKMEDANVDLEMHHDHDGSDHCDQDLKELSKTAFSDSDDEPLTVKSKKYKGKRRRKDKHGSVQKRKTKEQPSGVVKDPRVEKKLRDLNMNPGSIALVMLSWEEVEEERRLALQSVQFTRHVHRCAACVVGYNHVHKLREHNKKHSPEAGDEVCEVCTIRCKTRAALASHRRRHRARWVCQGCGCRYSQACVAADHCARAHHAPPPTHRCPHCAHVDTSLGALRMHIKSHSSRPECTLCGKTFRDKSSLRTHAFVHRGEKEHACSTCEKRFTFKKQKEIHEITHMQHQHLYCHQCDVSFKNQTSYYQHMKYNLKHIDPADIKHACPLCDKRFVKAKRLEEHNLAVHLKLAPIKCAAPDCTFSCPSRAALRSHTRLVHRGARALRNHVCHRCGNTYKSKKSLEGHLRSHNVTRQTTEAASA